ncbi:MAG: DUF192 domain-containing protein [Actinomycetota bacterium]
MATIMGPGARVVAVNVHLAAGPRERMKGLIGAPPLGPRDALVLPRAPQVHSFGLRVAIDVAFCDVTGRVLHVIREMRPRRMSHWVRGTHHTIEMAAGALATIGTGDVLEIRDL